MPVVEIRILWGSTLLAVRHLDPPRSFVLGGAGADFAVDLHESFLARGGEPHAQRAVARQRELVLARGGELFVLAPRGASGTVVSSPARSRTLAEAIADGTATPHEGAPGVHAIRLVPGASVSLALSTGAPGSGYRTNDDDEGPSADRLVFEIALVRAGGRVARGRWRDQARLAASVFFVAALAALLLVAGEHRRWTGADEEDAYAERLYLIATALGAIEDKNAPEPSPQSTHRSGYSVGYIDAYYRLDSGAAETDPIEASSTTSLLGMDPMALSRCVSYGRSLILAPEPPPFPPPFVAVCRAPFLGPMGLPGIGEPLPVDPVHAAQEPSVFWYEQIADAEVQRPRLQLSPAAIPPRGRPTEPRRSRFQLHVKRLRGDASEDVVLRELRARRAVIQRCIDLDKPPAGRAEHRALLEIDREGVALSLPSRRWISYGVSLPARPDDHHPGHDLAQRCLVGALEGIRLGEPDGAVSSFVVDMVSPGE